MTEDEYRSRVLHMESWVNRLSFLCDDSCKEKFGRDTWAHHGNATITYLTECVDAMFYDVSMPLYPSTGVKHLDEDVARHRDYFTTRWAIEEIKNKSDALMRSQ